MGLEAASSVDPGCLLPRCPRQVLAYSPIGLGLLSGKYSAEQLPEGPRAELAKAVLRPPSGHLGQARLISARLG